MEVATTKEARALSNKTKAITPGTLKEVLSSYATIEYVDSQGGGGGGGGGTGLVNDVRVNGTSVLHNKIAYVTVPTSLSQLINNAGYVQLTDNYIPDNLISDNIKQQVVSVASSSSLPRPGQEGKIYTVTFDNKIYRWDSQAQDYIELSESLHLGETQDTAYRGDRGKLAYDHSQIINGNPHGLTLATFNIAVSATEINYLENLNKNIMVALQEKLNLTGGAMTGYLTLNSGPVLNMHAATKQYVDASIGTVAISVHQRVSHFSSVVDTLNEQAQKIGQALDTIIEVDSKVEGYSFVEYVLKSYIEQEGKFRIDTIYYTKENDTYTEYPQYKEYTDVRTGNPNALNLYEYDDETYTLTEDETFIVDKTYYIKQYEIDEDFPEGETFYCYIGDFQDGDSIVPTEAPDITYKEGIHYYLKNNNILEPLIEGTDYNINEEILGDVYCDNTYEKETTYSYEKSLDTRFKSGRQYYRENYTPILTEDTNFEDFKIYYKNVNGEYQELIPLIDYHVGDSLSVVTGAVYERGYSGTYTSLVVGIDYNVGDYIEEQLYHYVANENYFLTSDTVFDETKTYYYRELSSGIDTVLNTHQETLSNISVSEGSITSSVATIQSFIDTDLKGDNGILKKIKDVDGKLSNLDVAVGGVVGSTSNLGKTIQGLLGANATLNSSISSIEYKTQNVTTDSYSKTEVQKIIDGTGYFLTRDTVYSKDRTYYIKDITTNLWKEFTNYTIGDPIPDNQIYEYGKTKVVASESGKFDENGLLIATEEVYGYTYKLTNDETFQPATHYYKYINNNYVQQYAKYNIPTPDTTYVANKIYYKFINGIYVAFPGSESIVSEDEIFQDNKNYYKFINNLPTLLVKKVYTQTQDTTYTANKQYYKYSDELEKYYLFTDWNAGDEIPENPPVYECAGDYNVGDEIEAGTIYELKINWTANESIPGDITLYEETGDYDLGAAIQANTYYVEDKEKTRFTSNTIGRYNQEGMRIRRVTDPNDEETNEEILYAGVDENETTKSVVRTVNLETKEYLYAAEKHLRIEKFKDTNMTDYGWGMFYL